MTKTLRTAEPPRSHKTVDLPELPDSIRRLHALRWEELTEGRGFTGDHLRWRDSPNRQYKDTGPQSPDGKLISLAPPPCADIRDRNPPGKRTFIGKNGEELDYQQWRDQTLADWHAGYSVRADRWKESIGIAETIALAKARFDSIAQDYFSVLTAPGVSEAQFDRGVEALQRLVVGEVTNLWLAEGDWFQRVCQPRVEDAFPPLIKELKRRGRKLWIERLDGEANGAGAAQVQPSPVSADNSVPAPDAAKRTKRELTADEIDDLLGGKNAVSWDTAAEALQREKRQLRNLVAQGKLSKTSDGKMITTESIRKLLGPQEATRSDVVPFGLPRRING